MDPSDPDSDIVALDAPTDYADNNVDSMILATARAHPEATRKFLVRTPALMAKQAKNQQQMERCAEKAAAKCKQNDAEDNDDDEPKAKKAKGKAKKKDSDDPPPSITYYINIPKPLPLTPRSNINESKITWKPKKPKNGEKLPLGKNTAYQAMVQRWRARLRGSCCATLHAAPTKPMEEATPWETNDEPVPSFDYTQLEPTGAADSVAQQKESFNKATKEERTKLEEKYTVGNYPNFPDRCVYFDAQTGFYFELNALRLRIWASVMAQGTTDENKPPTSKFFDANQGIKTIPSVAVPAPAPAVLAPPALPPSAPVPAPNPVPHLCSMPPSAVKRHTVPLDRFCELYALDATDAALLKSRIHGANLRFKADLASGTYD
ncbi:hypothetical protein B0H13DRAFT_2034671 [Mycena leptocephala]|nr:hypothetical protein B0H13DRAFT_2034671 [Mycena leptocephala]